MSNLDSARRGSVPVSKLVAFACACVVALLAFTGAWLLAGGEGAGERPVWPETLRVQANDVEREVTAADRLLRLFILQGKQADADRFERGRTEAGAALAAMTTTAQGADPEARDAAAAFADAVRKWLELSDTWFKAARDEAGDATRTAVLARIGPDDPLDNVVGQRRALRNAIDRAVSTREAADAAATNARSTRVAAGFTFITLAALLAVVLAWLASRATAEGRAVDIGLMRAVLDQLPDAVAIFGGDGRIIVSNLAAARAIESGVDAAGRLALYAADGNPVDDAESPLSQALAGIHVVEREFFASRLDGSLAPVEVHAEPILDNGRASAAVIVMRDNGERRRIEEEMEQLADQKAAAEINCADIGRRLRAVEAELTEALSSADQLRGEASSARRDAETRAARFARLVGNASIGVALFESQDMRLVDANEPGLVMLGERRRERDVRGSTLVDIAPGAEGSGLLDLFRKVLASGETYSSQEYLAQGLRHGNAYWRFALVPLEAGELLLLGVDVSDDVERRGGRSAASQGDWTIEDVLLAIANDLRTPILSIQGMVGLFRQKYAEAVPDVTALHYLELTQRNADQIAALIEDLVALSSLGHEELKTSEIPLAAAIEEAWRASARHGIELRVAGPLPTVKADRTKLMSAFRDMFDTAARRKRESDGAWIHVRVRDLGGQWEIELADNAKPVEGDEGERLFGPLARHLVAMPNDGGPTLIANGLALAAVRRIAELHGGNAMVSPAPDESGTIYSITIAK